MTRILITGAAGYVGGVLVGRLHDDPGFESVVGVDAWPFPTFRN